MSKIALGTAQFGLDYGINNQRGKVPEQEISRILALAASRGIDTLDTAAAYGDSEERLGLCMNGADRNFKIVSKLPRDANDPAAALAGSLSRLKTDSLYGYLFHDFTTYTGSPALWEAFGSLKAQGKVKKIGFSFYYPAELEQVFDDGLNIDLVQVPYNLFDRRFESYFGELKKRGIEIHVRSVFLQGLFFRDSATLSSHFDRIKEKLAKLRHIAAQSEVSPLELALDFVLAHPLIDKAVVGIDGMDNLQQILDAASGPGKSVSLPAGLEELRENDESVILPMNWEKERAGVR